MENHETEDKCKLTFEQLPEVVLQLRDQLPRIEAMLGKLNSIPAAESPLLNLQQASRFLNLAESTIYSKVCRMQIPVIKKGKKLYFQKAELLAWLMEGKRKPQSVGKDAAADFFAPSTLRKAARQGPKR